MILLIVFFSLAIGFSFLCSVLEAVLLSVSSAYTHQEQEKGTQTGKLLESFKKDIDRPLSAILTLNTIAHTVGAIGVGAQAGKIFGHNYFHLLGFSLSYESIIAAVMTLAVLILSEIIPKTLGANNWRNLAPISMRTIQILIWILLPIVWTTEKMTYFLKKDKESSIFSRADFAALAKTGEKSGQINASESIIIQNMLRFGSQTIANIFTPLEVIYTLDSEQEIGNIPLEDRIGAYSRIPVWSHVENKFIGIILKDDILHHLAQDNHHTLVSSLVRDVDFVSENSTLLSILEKALDMQQHLFLVMRDEKVVGLVTMEDVLETLFDQEIIDESDTIADLRAFAMERHNS